MDYVHWNSKICEYFYKSVMLNPWITAAATTTKSAIIDNIIHKKELWLISIKHFTIL